VKAVQFYRTTWPGLSSPIIVATVDIFPVRNQDCDALSTVTVMVLTNLKVNKAKPKENRTNLPMNGECLYGYTAKGGKWWQAFS